MGENVLNCSDTRFPFNGEKRGLLQRREPQGYLVSKSVENSETFVILKHKVHLCW